jgi:hypothetical protein
MNGIHDLGGMQGLGPIDIPRDEPVFYGRWEADVFATIALMFAGDACTVDTFRHSIERMDAAEYLQTRYYVHWLHAAETLGVELGFFTKEELEVRVLELEGIQNA